MDSRLNPSGRSAVKSRYVNGALYFYAKDGSVLRVMDPVNNRVFSVGTVINKRQRITIANVNAGITLLPAIPGFKYRLVSCYAIAYGGACTTLTTVDVLGTQSTSQKLVAYAQASLTQSTVLKDGGTGAAVLADGASYVACDAGTAITVGKTGGTGAGATGIDIDICYVIEQ